MPVQIAQGKMSNEQTMNQVSAKKALSSYQPNSARPRRTFRYVNQPQQGQLIMSLLFDDEQRKRTAWNRASPIDRFDANLWRRDRFGSAIKWTDYGDRSSDYGWEIDHRVPTSLGGLNLASNLEALHWRNNVAKSDSFLS
jgi:hypothetical protein